MNSERVTVFSPGAASAARNVAPAREVLAQSVACLVATLGQARTSVAQGHADRARELLARARAELDVADENLLALDRNRERSAFRQSQRIRQRLDALATAVAREATPPAVLHQAPPAAAAA